MRATCVVTAALAGLVTTVAGGLVKSDPAVAGEADVVNVHVRPGPSGTFGFDVSVRHADEGWDHYANKWEVLAPDGTVLGTRVLYHPHVGEQPFTRSLENVRVPADIGRITVRAFDSVHGDGGKTVTVRLPNR
jgi:hypothetical protein